MYTFMQKSMKTVLVSIIATYVVVYVDDVLAIHKDPGKVH
jgi:hypothetical protein